MECDLASLLNRPSRRAFMGTALAATDATGLDAGPVLIPARDRDLPAKDGWARMLGWFNAHGMA